jgi:hypothetical protein
LKGIFLELIAKFSYNKIYIYGYGHEDNQLIAAAKCNCPGKIWEFIKNISAASKKMKRLKRGGRK